MQGFKKLALATAILAASSSALAMQAMDDESLSSTTGQDGLTVVLDTNVTTSIKWVDRDGTGVAGFTNAGAVVISNVGISSTGLQIDIDAGGNAGTGAGTNGLLNIGISNPNGITIDLSSTTLAVADAVNVPSGGWTTETLAQRSTTGAATNFITFSAGSALTIAGAPGRLIDIQLGSEPGDFMTLNGNLGSITLTGMNIIDADGGTGGDISIGTLTLANIDLVNSTVNVDAGGLVINTGTGLTAVEVGIERLALGDETAVGNGFVGDVYLSGLNVSNNTIRVHGH